MASSSGPPYPPNTAQVGGVPTVGVDIPISACLLLVYISLAAVHMTIFQVNRKREHKFIFSAMLFGLSVARTAALTMRIVWATRQTNTQIAIAANILTQAGVIILFIANLFFAQRLVRAYQPVGWHIGARIVFRFLVACVVACLVMVIICTVHSFYTLDANARRMDRDVQLVAGVYLAFLAFAPTPAVIIAIVLRRNKDPEKFGSGRLRTKIALLIFTSLLLTLGAGFRIGTSFAPRPLNDPAWYDNKACYYTLNFGIEIIVSALYAAVRFDRRFHIPNGAKGPGDYAKGNEAPRVNTEADFYGEGDSAAETVSGAGPTEGQWEESFRKEQRGEDGATV
ncbi:hypothetical protein BJ170DRAFT_629829 [Xylariales sp. AK1849]|nr:hypothetical protein BJ170DRAFT_629829 [Xylariales sp. AK1849]